MPDAIFADPRLAARYDTFDGDRGDLDAYVAIADELGARRILDVGCGTGTLAALLARGGRTVVGIDPAEASLAIARTKSDAVTWLLGPASDLPLIDADLALMTGNVAQVFLTDDDWHGALRAVRAALGPGGHLVFETRRPEARAWDAWALDTGPVVRDGVEQRRVVTEVRLPFVSFRHTYRFPDGSEVTSDSTLRFRDRDEIATSLAGNGFRVVDVRDAPDRPGLENVFIASVQGADQPPTAGAGFAVTGADQPTYGAP